MRSMGLLYSEIWDGLDLRLWDTGAVGLVSTAGMDIVLVKNLRLLRSWLIYKFREMMLTKNHNQIQQNYQLKRLHRLLKNLRPKHNNDFCFDSINPKLILQIKFI